jgi:hypothetical protein
MNQKELADWIKAEAAKGISFRQLALSLGTSPTTINALRDETRSTISDELLEAIALRRKESVKDTASWLGVEPPGAYDLPAKFAVMESRLSVMEQQLAYAIERLSEQERIDPALTLDSYLLEKGINVRHAASQRTIEAAVLEVAPKSAAGFERFLLIVLGIIPARPEDLPLASAVLRNITGEPWTPAEVGRVLSQGR